MVLSFSIKRLIRKKFVFEKGFTRILLSKYYKNLQLENVIYYTCDKWISIIVLILYLMGKPCENMGRKAIGATSTNV
jgi:hypothetical protein